MDHRTIFRRLFPTIALGLVLTPAALAGPVHEVGADFNGGSYQVGSSIYPAAGAIFGAQGASVVYQPGHNAGLRYCNPFGANTRLSEIRIRAIRWHTQALTGFMRVNTPGGESWRMTSNEMPVGHHNYGFVGAGGAGPGQCVSLEYYQSGATQGGAGWRPSFTSQMDAVRVEDLQGPAVSGVATPAGWVTGGQVYVEWDHSDNGLGRVGTGARVSGAGETGIGDPGDGRSGAWVSAGSLPDGTHSVSGFRDGVGWPRAEQAASFRLDRNAPQVPALTLAPDTQGAWTSQNVVITTAPTGDGTGSLWARNLLSNGAVNQTTVSAEGETTLTATAVDNAGHQSNPSAGRTIRIDKTAPIAKIALTPTGPGRASASVAGTTDGLSGVRRWELRLNGSTGDVVATSANPTALDSLGASGPLATGGTFRFHLAVEDNAGNPGTALSTPERFDALAPGVLVLSSPAGFVRAIGVVGEQDNRIRAAFSDNLQDGLGEVEVQLLRGGTWQTTSRFNAPGMPSLSQGEQLLATDLPDDLSDGRHELRIVARDPSYPQTLSTTTAPIAVSLDRTSPKDATPDDWTFTHAGSGRFSVKLAGLDDAGSGVANVAVFASADPAGGQGPLVKVGEIDAPGANPEVTADLSAFGASGLHATQVVATDRAGNVLSAPGPSLPLDQIAPEITSFAVDQATFAATLSFRDEGGFGACPVRIELQGAGTQASWKELVAQPAAAVAPTLQATLSVAGMAGGSYQVRASVCDAAGNSASSTVGLTLADKVHAQQAADLSGIRLPPLTSPQSKLQREVEGQIAPVIRTAFGKKVSLKGILVRGDGNGASGIAVELRDPAGRFVQGTRSGPGGAFSFGVRASLGGTWSVVAPGVPELRAPAVLEVRPILRARFLKTTVRAGQEIVVQGTIRPRAVSLGKLIQLQWKDPRRGWRPVANGRVAKDGHIRLSYTFVAGGGYTLLMRLVVPEERGWGFSGVATKAAKVRVR